MPLVAIGIGGRRNPDGSITVKVEIRSTTGTSTTLITTTTYTGADLSAVQAAIEADLISRRAAERDSTLNNAVAGRVLASVE